MNKLKLKSFMASYYNTGWEKGVELLDIEVNTWMKNNSNLTIDKIEHTRFETREVIHIWYTS